LNNHSVRRLIYYIHFVPLGLHCSFAGRESGLGISLTQFHTRGAGPAQSAQRLGCGQDGRGSIPERSWEQFSSTSRSYRVCGPPKPPSQWVLGALSSGAKMSTHLRQLPRLRMRGAMPPVPHTSSWRGTWLTRGAITFTYILTPGYHESRIPTKLFK